MNSRRKFLENSGKSALGLAFAPGIIYRSTNRINMETNQSRALFFKLSLAQWSFHKALKAGEMDNLDFAAKAQKLGFAGIEYVNSFFKRKAKKTSYLNEMITRAEDNGVETLLIMVDGEGGLGETSTRKRLKAVENHYKWVEAAKHLGCHSIRVNAYGVGSASDVAAAAVDGLGRLTDFAAPMGINIIVENHGGYSSNGKWLADVMKKINHPGCGTLPDFGNFCIERSEPDKEGNQVCLEEYDRYIGVKELMPYAKAVSAKSNDFDTKGNEMYTDYYKMMKIVKDAGYTGYVGVEYEGKILSEEEGVVATRKLLEKVGKAI